MHKTQDWQFLTNFGNVYAHKFTFVIIRSKRKPQEQVKCSWTEEDLDEGTCFESFQ